MNNDLISRSALKEAYLKEFWAAMGEDKSFDAIGTMTKVIDNAPTVEIPDYSELHKAVGYNEGYTQALKENARPQGDLISRNYVENIVKAEFVDLRDGTEEWRTYVNDTCENILCKVNNVPTVDIQSSIKRDVWELYQRHQSHLGTYVYEFGIELKELLSSYGETKNDTTN